MDSYIDNFAASVRRILDRSSRETNDFVSLAISGEQLRRACEVGDPSHEALETLKRYDEALPSYAAPSLEQLQLGVAESVAELEQYAASPRPLRDITVGQANLLRLDETLSLAGAAVRGGFVSKSEASALASPLTNRVRSIASACFELAQAAEDRQILFGSDPLIPELYEWWEPLASLAPSRLALQATVVADARRERLIHNAVAKFESSRSRPWHVRLKERLQAMFPVTLVADRQAQLASYADPNRLPDEQEELVSEEDFSVFRAGKFVVFKVAKPHSLEPVSIMKGAEQLTIEVLDETCFRVPLPNDDGDIRAVIRIDGEQLDLVPIEFRVTQ